MIRLRAIVGHKRPMPRPQDGKPCVGHFIDMDLTPEFHAELVGQNLVNQILREELFDAVDVEFPDHAQNLDWETLRVVERLDGEA